MLRRLITDYSDHKHIVTHISQQPELTYYYMKFEENHVNSRGGNKPFEFDAQGVPRIHSYIDVEDAGYYYYPITIGQYGLAVFHTFLNTGDQEKKEQFISIADWFYNNAIDEDRLGVYWLTEVDKPEFKIFTPWKSAFAQSRGISILLRAWQLTRDDRYYDTAVAALGLFDYDTSEGGVRVGTSSSYFYEEYVAEAPTRILDGMMFSLFGLYDLMRVTKRIDEDNYRWSRRMFEDGIAGLSHWLPRFDMGYWVYYNRCDIQGYPPNDPCTVGYLRLIVSQLGILHQLTGQEILKAYRDRFESYNRPFNILKMYRQKYKALKALNRL